MSKPISPQFVAHRGYSSQYPENTLPSLEQALREGACFIECDVQLTKDCLPVLLHDAELERVTGYQGIVHDLAFVDVKDLSVNYPGKFGRKYSGISIPLLSDLVELMKQWPTRRAFVEVKRSSIQRFGREFTVQRILDVVQEIKQQVIIISFDSETIELIKLVDNWQTGWVIEEWSEENLATAEKLKSDYLFVDVECIPADITTLPSVSWFWALYEIDDPELASAWIKRGASYIETNDIASLLQYKPFTPCGCYG